MEQDIHICLSFEEHEILVQSEKGLSNAVWHGIERANGDKIVVMDGDGSHNPRYIMPMVSLLGEKVDVVVGCRESSMESFYRKIINRTMALMVRYFLRVKVSDPLSGFVVGKKEAFNFSEREGFKFGLEVLMNNNPHFAEFPIVFEERKAGKSKAGPIHVMKLLKQVWRLKK